MQQEQFNKRYVRQNVAEEHQGAFFDFFMKINDHQQFHEWSQDRIKTVVEEFKRARLSTSFQTMTTEVKKLKVSPKKTDPCDNKTLKGDSPKLTRSASVGKKEQAINFLKDIEEKFLHSPGKPNPKVTNWKGIQDSIWLNFQATQANKKAKKNFIDKDLFENFDSCILTSSTTLDKDKKYKAAEKNILIIKSSLTQNNEPSSKGIKVEEISKTPPFDPVKIIQMKRSLQIRPVSSELKKSRMEFIPELRQKRSTNTDKIFKSKLNEEVPCKKLKQIPQLTGIKVTVSHHEIVHRTLLPDIVIYHINVDPGKKICKRTYDNFLQLHQIMVKLFPGVKIPSLDSGSWFSESDIALINKNKIALEMFLSDIMEHPTLSKTDIFRQFLTIPDLKNIEKSLEDYDKIPKKNSFGDLCNEEGVLKLCLSEESNGIIARLPKWKKIFEHYFERHTDLISNLASQLQSVKYTYNQMTHLTSQFQIKIRQLFELKSIMNLEEIEQLLDKQMQYFGRQRKQLEKNIINLKQKYNTVIKYQKLNVSSFEMIQSVPHLTQKYLKRLENEPESPSSQLETSPNNLQSLKFNSDIWRQHQNLGLFRCQLGYLNSQLIIQAKIFNQKMTKNLSNIWNQTFQPKQGCLKS